MVFCFNSLARPIIESNSWSDMAPATSYTICGAWPGRAETRNTEDNQRVEGTVSSSLCLPERLCVRISGLGDKDQALTFLEQAYEEQDPALFYLKVWPFLDPLRSEPRFQALLHRLNLSQ